MSDTCIKHIEPAWKLKTELSNDLFNDGKFENSLSGYQEALCRAEVLNDNLLEAKRTGVPVIQIIAISCNNMAYTYENLGMIKEGEKMLKRVIYFLLLQSNNNSINTEEIQNELKRAMLNYTEFANRNGIEIKNTQKVFSDIQEQFKTYETI